MRASRILAFAGGGVALAVLPLLLSDYQTSLAIQILIFALLGMSIDLLAGYAGRTSLGHGAIFGVSTYIAIYWSSTLHGSPWVGILLGIIGAMALALVFALLAVRTSGVYFLLLTLALGMVVWGICLRWNSVTGAENGLRGDARPLWLATSAALYWLVLAVVALASWLAWLVVKSPFGLTLRGIRDSESRMLSLGFHSTRHLVLAFVVSGLLAGVGGGLYALFNEFVSPSTVAVAASVRGLLIAISGGIGTLFGSFLGAFVLVVLENVVSGYTERWQSVMGLLFIAMMIFAPTGLIGQWHRFWQWRRLGARDKPEQTKGT